MGATSQKTVTGTFRFHIWGPKHVGHQAHLQKNWSESTRFSGGTPSLLLGLMAQTSLEEFQLSAPSPHDVIDTCCLRGRGPQGGPHQVQLKSGWAVTQSFSLFRALPFRWPVYGRIRARTSQYACSVFLARVFPGGRASGSVWLTDWPISWGEHTLSPSLRVVHQKIKIFFFTLKNPDEGWWPSPGPYWPLLWGEWPVSPSEEEVYHGGTLTFSVNGPKGSGSGPRLGGVVRWAKKSETADW